MIEDFDEFYRKESYRANRRSRDRREDRDFKKKVNEEEKKEKKEADKKAHVQQIERDKINNQVKEKLQTDKLVSLATIEKYKNEQKIISEEKRAENNAIVTADTEKVRAEKDKQIKVMDVEANARILKAQQDFYPRKLDLDFKDEEKRSNLDVQEYTRKALTDRNITHFLRGEEHREQRETIKVALWAKILENAQKHNNKKDFETHKTSEKIRLAKALSIIKQEEGFTTDEEAIDFIRRHSSEWDD